MDIAGSCMAAAEYNPLYSGGYIPSIIISGGYIPPNSGGYIPPIIIKNS